MAIDAVLRVVVASTPLLRICGRQPPLTAKLAPRQTAMAFVDSSEDMNSIAMTAVDRLLRTHNVDPASIGRLEVRVRATSAHASI